MNNTSMIYPPAYRTNDSGRRFTWGTIFIPLGFLLAHTVILSQVQVVYLLLRAFLKDGNLSVAADPEALQNLLMSNLTSMFLFAGPILIGVYLLSIYALRKRGRREAYVFWGPPRASDGARAVAIAIGCVGVATLLLQLFQELGKSSHFFATRMETYQQLSSGFIDDSSYVTQIIAMSIFVPLAEELLFRGIIMGEFRRAMPDWLAIISCGLLFAVFHLNFVQSSYVLFAGLAISAAYVWGRSFWLAFILHAVFNFFGSSVALFVGESETAGQVLYYGELLFVLIAVVCLLFSYRSRLNKISPKQREVAEAGISH